MNGFGDAPMKKEGELFLGAKLPDDEPMYEYTWLEMQVPDAIEDKCGEAVIKCIKEHGYPSNWKRLRKPRESK
jgi:hypothetical protein